MAPTPGSHKYIPYHTSTYKCLLSVLMLYGSNPNAPNLQRTIAATNFPMPPWPLLTMPHFPSLKGACHPCRPKCGSCEKCLGAVSKNHPSPEFPNCSVHLLMLEIHLPGIPCSFPGLPFQEIRPHGIYTGIAETLFSFLHWNSHSLLHIFTNMHIPSLLNLFIIDTFYTAMHFSHTPYFLLLYTL